MKYSITQWEEPYFGIEQYNMPMLGFSHRAAIFFFQYTFMTLGSICIFKPKNTFSAPEMVENVGCYEVGFLFCRFSADWQLIHKL